MSSKSFQILASLLLTILLCVTVIYASDEDNEIADPLAEDCRRQLNNCLDQVENRVPGVPQRGWIFLESFLAVVFDIDACCDEYKQCMYRIGRNRP